MATVAKFDRINVLDGRRSMPFEQFFGEMELSEEEKKRRIELAEQFEILFQYYFLLFDDGTAVDLVQMLEEKYIEIADLFLGASVTTAYILDHARRLAEDINDVTERKAEDDEYWLSDDRAMLIAENEANVVGNYEEYADAIAAGLTQKTWHTMEDRRVRETHRAVNGVTVDIFEPFYVGNSEMQFPGDETADPQETVNCRCHVEYS